MTFKTRKPRGRLGASGAIAGFKALYGNPDTTQPRKGWQSSNVPRNWRDRLPDPAVFYPLHVAKLGKPRNGWAQGLCPFHEDRSASFSVHVENPRGGWRCFAGCGSGDMVSFLQKLRGSDFKDAVRELVGVRV